MYLLYRCGGFAPTTEEEVDLIDRFKIPEDQVIRRHGTKRLDQLKRILSNDLFAAIEPGLKTGCPGGLRQTSDIIWDGGYFGSPGRSEDAEKVPDTERGTWRKEYLPGPTSLFATTICGAISGVLARLRPSAEHFRVTLHRTLVMPREELLQQACEYVGRSVEAGAPTSGRTFPAKNATIGLAYITRRAVRSKKDTSPDDLQAAMKLLNLNAAPREMSKTVGFVLAIPILQPTSRFYRPSPISGVIYIDSKDSGFWLSDDEVRELALVIGYAVTSVQEAGSGLFDRIRNTPLLDVVHSAQSSQDVPEEAQQALEAIMTVEAPTTREPFIFNFDHSDLTPLMLSAGGTFNPHPLE